MMAGFASQRRACKHDAPPTIPWAAVASVAVVIGSGAPAAAQVLGTEDLDGLQAMAVTRCLDTMEAGSVADLSGLRPVTDVDITVFTDNAATVDDRIVLDLSTFLGLRWCEVANNQLTARFDGDEGFAQATQTLDHVSETLLERGYIEGPPCIIETYRASGARLLEPGDYLRRFSSATEARPGLFLQVGLSAARYSADLGVRVEEHYGAPEIGC